METPPSRALYLRFPFGHPLGEAGNRNQQLAVLYHAFSLLFEARRPATVKEGDLQWKGQRYLPPDWDKYQELGPKER